MFMSNLKQIGAILIIIGVVVGLFGYWLSAYNDKIAQNQQNETGTCYLPDGTCLHQTSDSILYATTAIAVVIGLVGAYLILKKKEVKTVVVKRIVQKEAPQKKDSIRGPLKQGPATEASGSHSYMVKSPSYDHG